MEKKKIYAVTERWYSSYTGDVLTKVKFVFSSIEEAKEYIKKELEGDLDWYITEYLECDDEEYGNEIRKEARRFENEEDHIYGVYPEDGERKWFEYQIDEVIFLK